MSSEISSLAEQFSNEINNVQTSGIDLNGNLGKSMFSVNSMAPKANSNNKVTLNFNMAEGNPSKIVQEKIFVSYSQPNNNWEIRNSNGLGLVYPGSPIIPSNPDATMCASLSPDSCASCQSSSLQFWLKRSPIIYIVIFTPATPSGGY